MTDIRKLLLDADPLRDETRLSPADVDAIRQAMIAAATAPHRRHFVAWLPLVAAAVVVTAMALAVTMNRAAARSMELKAADQAPDAAETRQVQFATPGGTRVIWVFDPQFR